MLGAVAGDIIGSVFEFMEVKSEDFELFTPGVDYTDDTVMTIATADAIINNKPYALAYKEWGRRYPNAGYGGMFRGWLQSESSAPYGSYGNGSAMRISPVGFAFSTLEDTLVEARKSAEVTHDHPEGIKGAQSVASAIFMARTGSSKEEIWDYIVRKFGYDLSRTLDDIRPTYGFDETCQGSVPESLIAFLESSSYEDAVRKAVSLGGDSDTMACIAGGIAQAFYKGVPDKIARDARKFLPEKMIDILDKFNNQFNVV